MAARRRQLARLAGTGALCNGDMDGRLTRRQVPLDGALAARLLSIRDRIALSGRGHDRVLRVARTIADLDGRELRRRDRRGRGAVVPARHVAAGRRVMYDSCDACLRRAFLIAHLAPRIAGTARPASAGGRTACSACPRRT